MLFDLDGFKTYNDTFGHPAGDALLTRLGAKLGAVGGALRRGLPARRRRVLRRADHRAPTRLEDVIAGAAHALSESRRGVRHHAPPTASCCSPTRPTTPRAGAAARRRAHVLPQARALGRRASRRATCSCARCRPSSPTCASTRARWRSSRWPSPAGSAWPARRSTRSPAPPSCTTSARSASRTRSSTSPRPLDATEWELMHQHTILGERILNAAPALRPVARIVRSTHERWDGTGYPDGLRGAEIPPRARIVAVCDAYEAMTSDRAYRAAHRPRGRLPGAARHGGHASSTRRSSTSSSPRSPSSPDPCPTRTAPGRRCSMLADRVRSLLGSAKLEPCPPSPAGSTDGGETTPTPLASRPAST